MAVGAQNSVLVRDMFQRALVSAALLFLCISLPAVLASYWVFLLCGQSASIAGSACVCLACGIFYEPACIVYTLINKILIANHKVLRDLLAVRVLYQSWEHETKTSCFVFPAYR